MTGRFKSNHKEFKKNKAKAIYKQFEENEKQEKKNRKTKMEAVSEVMNLPADVLLDAPVLVVTGKRHICLENYKSIIEYNGTVIKVQTKYCKICIEGKQLNIDYFTEEEMRISGIIQAIRYI